MYNEEYIKRITYGTPENIRIRQFYNQLNNRPLNYGMEDLFPNVNSYTAEPMSTVNNVNWSEPQENNQLSEGWYGSDNPDYIKRKNEYYNSFNDQFWRNVAEKTEKGLEILGNFPLSLISNKDKNVLSIQNDKLNILFGNSTKGPVESESNFPKEDSVSRALKYILKDKLKNIQGI